MTAPVTLGAGGLAGDDHRYARRVRSNLLGAGGQVVRSIRLPCRWKTDPCSKPVPIVCALTTHTSAPASMAHVGRS